MEFQKKRVNQNYRFKNRTELQEVIQHYHKTSDRKYLTEMMKPIILFLDEHEIHEFENFIMIFKNNGFKADDIYDLILTFINYININESFPKINWIKFRQLKKSNFGEKNIILNRIAIEYPDEFVYFAKDYSIKHNLSSSSNQDLLFQILKSKVFQLRNTSQISAFLKHFQ